MPSRLPVLSEAHVTGSALLFSHVGSETPSLQLVGKEEVQVSQSCRTSYTKATLSIPFYLQSLKSQPPQVDGLISTGMTAPQFKLLPLLK